MSKNRFRTEEIRSAIMKALSGPPVEELVDQIMSGRPGNHFGHHFAFHPFYGPMPFPPFPRRGYGY